MSTSSLSIQDAKKAKAKAERRESNQYQQVEAEPHDPQYLSHQERRDTRLHEREYNCGQLRDTVVEEVDGEQVPMKLSEAREQYLSLKYNQMETDGWYSPLDRAKDLYGRALGGERKLVDEIQNPSLLFLSLRQSPVEYNRGRRWIEPLRLRSELNKAWGNVRQTLYRKLSKFDRWEYVWVCSYTRSAATPHLHVLVYVDDPHDELSISTARSAVDSFVRANDYAEKRYHQVTKGESDAGIVAHSVPRDDDRISDESYRRVYEHRDGDVFKRTSSFLLYMMTQYPHFVLSHIWNGDSDLHAHDPLVDGATVSWASQFDEYGSSRGFPDTPD
jgi:hypothetical protein